MRDIKKEITMTQEDKEELLLKDLSARLPYHPIIFGKHDIACNEGPLGGITSSGIMFITGGGTHCHYFFKEVKPYLRPMSSMTEEEREEWADLFMKPICELEQYVVEKEAQDIAPVLYGKSHSISIDWLNSRHFDYRNLIEKGLALEAPEGMYA